jgi:hypothetical protein
MVRARGRKLFLILYAAIGPLLLWCVYVSVRERLGISTARMDDTVLLVAVVSGAACAFQGLPGNRLVRSGVTLVYLASMTALTLFAGLYFECSQGNCL